MSDASTDDENLAAEFDALAERAGLIIVEARRDGLLRGYRDLKRMTSLTRQPRTAAAEPAGVFSILTVTRGV